MPTTKKADHHKTSSSPARQQQQPPDDEPENDDTDTENGEGDNSQPEAEKAATGPANVNEANPSEQLSAWAQSQIDAANVQRDQAREETNQLHIKLGQAEGRIKELKLANQHYALSNESLTVL